MNLKEFLSSSGLSDYYATIAQDVELPAELVGYSHEELKNDFGIDKRAHRNRLLQAIAALSLDTKQESAAKGPSSCIIPVHLDALPAVIAFPLKEYCEESHPTMRLWAACDTIEMLLRFLVISAIAEQRQGGKLDPKLVRGLSGLIESPTLGAWYSMAVKLAKTAPKQSLMPEYADSVNGVLHKLLYGPENPGNPETSFLRLRNRLAHGGGLTRKEGTRLLALWQQRFESALEACSWLENLDLIGRRDDGAIACLDGLAAPQPFELPDAVKLEESGSLWLVRGSSHCLLWPLAIFGQTMTEILGNSRKSDTYHAQIYSRKEAVRLTYTPFGAAGFHYSESGPDEMEAFERLFSVDTGERKSGFTIQDFNKELLRDAGQMVGRRRELDTIKEALATRHQGVWWLSGVAGMGKSFLMAGLFAELKNQSLDSGEPYVFAYRFRAGDRHRCNRDAFVTFLNERLRAAGILHEHFEPKKDGKTIERLEHCLKHIKQGQQVTVLLDGLDEITRSDPDFATEIPLAVELPGIRLVLAGRPEEGLTRAMAEKGAIPLFPDGLPPMSENDIRGMILDKIGPLRRVLIGHDNEEEDEVINPFVEKVTRLAAGLPLYVNYVIGDVLSAKYRVLDGDEQLPESLHAYHEELLKRLSVGSLQALLTPLVCLLALAYEPLSRWQLRTILGVWKVLPDEPSSNALLERGLEGLSTMLKAVPNSNGVARYTLFHDSLRSHLLHSASVAPTMNMARGIFADLAEQYDSPTSLLNYLWRFGIDHLLDVGRKEEAKTKLLCLSHLSCMGNVGLATIKVYRWWMRLGGEEEALHYLAILNECDVEQKDQYCDTLSFLLAICHEASWFRLGIPLEEFRLKHRKCILGVEHHDTLKSQHSLGELLRKKGDDDGAEPLLRQCFEVSERTLGVEHRDTIIFMSSLGNLLTDKGDHKSAEALLRRVLEVNERKQGAEHPDTLASMANLANLLYETDDYAAAEAIYRRVLEVEERTLGSDHNKTLTSMNNLGFLLESKGDYAGAEPLFRRCLEVKELTHGTDHPSTLTSLSNLGSLLNSKGDHIGAEIMYRRVLEVEERIHGAEHPDTISALHHLGLSLQSKGDYAGAEQLYRRCLEVNERTLGAEHDNTLATMQNLGALLNEKGDYAGAGQLYLRCLQVHERTLGGTHPDTLKLKSELADLLYKKGDYDSAEHLFRQCLEARERILGEEHRSNLRLASKLGNLLCKKGDFNGAESLYRHCFEVCERTLGGEHPDLLACLGNLCSLLKAKGDYASLERLYQRGIEVSELTLGVDHPTTLLHLNNLGTLLVATERLDAALIPFKRASEGAERHWGDKNQKTARFMLNFIQCKFLIGDERIRIHEVESVYQTLKSHNGENHPWTVECRELIAKLNEHS